MEYPAIIAHSSRLLAATGQFLRPASASRSSSLNKASAMIRIRFCALLLMATCLASAQANDKGELKYCGKDISDRDNFYRFERFRNNISLLPNNGSNQDAYSAIYKIYLRRLDDDEEALKSVQNFLNMLEEIVAGLTSARLNRSHDIRADLGEIEVISSRGHEVAYVHCNELNSKSGRDAVTDIAYILQTVQKIDEEGWFSLGRQVNPQVKFLSLKYDQWLENGIDMWPWEYYIWNQKLVAGDRTTRTLSKSQYTFFRPYLGVGGEAESWDDYRMKLTLAIDIIGYVGYTSRDYSSHKGLSLAVLFPEDQESSVGLLYKHNNFAFGIARNSDNDTESIFFGMDLLKLVADDLPYLQRLRIDAASEKWDTDENK